MQIKSLSLLVFSILLLSCKPEATIKDYVIQGMRSNLDSRMEKVTHLELNKGVLKILSFNGKSTNLTTISPWPEELYLEISISNLYVLSTIKPHPLGAVKIISLYQNKYLKMRIVDSAKKYHIVNSGWAILPGAALGSTLEGKGQWSGVLLSGPEQQRYKISPGEHKRIGDVDFYLLSAFRNADSTPNIADDAVELVVDYVLLWGGGMK